MLITFFTLQGRDLLTQKFEKRSDINIQDIAITDILRFIEENIGCNFDQAVTDDSKFENLGY